MDSTSFSDQCTKLNFGVESTSAWSLTTVTSNWRSILIVLAAQKTFQTSCEYCAKITIYKQKCRAQLRWHGTQRCVGREVKGQQENGVGTQQPSMTTEHSLPSTVQTLTADPHTSAASSWLNCGPCWVTRTHPFRRKMKSDFCVCAT
jgi:hypothetical protein